MTESSEAPSLHRQLRLGTKHPHHVLDHHPLLAPLIRPTLSREEYGNALAGLHGIYAQAEAWILDYLKARSDLFDYRPRRKLPALEADLAALGRAPVPSGAAFAPAPTIATLVGILYTLEGSAQGGQFIARNVLQVAPDLPVLFFSGYGEQSRQRWDEFLQFAEVRCPAEEHGAAVTMAASVFVAIKTHLDTCHREFAAA